MRRGPVAVTPGAADVRLPLAFIGAGLVALAVAVTTVATTPDLLLLPLPHPHVAALAHLWLPGFLLSVCIGALYQLMPVVLGAPLRLPSVAAWSHFTLHVGGVALLVAGFVRGRFELVALGGSGVALGAAVLVTAAWRTFRASVRRDAIGWSFPAAVSWLAATLLFGVVLALNRRAPFLPLSVVDLLHAHAHVGLVGFFLTLLQGATFQLVPMFTMADLRRPGLVRAGLAFSQVGLLVLTPGLACGRSAVAGAGALLIAAGVACSGVALVATLRSRRRRVLEPGIVAFAVGAALLAVVAIGGVALAVLPAGLVSFPDGAGLAYGLTLIVGALSFMILGMLCKIVPFLVWMKTYGPRAGRQLVPLATTLGSRVLERAWLGGHTAALALLVAGVLSSVPALIATGAALLAAAMATFLVNVIRIVAHLWSPQVGAPAAARATPVFP